MEGAVDDAARDVAAEGVELHGRPVGEQRVDLAAVGDDGSNEDRVVALAVGVELTGAAVPDDRVQVGGIVERPVPAVAVFGAAAARVLETPRLAERGGCPGRGTDGRDVVDADDRVRGNRWPGMAASSISVASAEMSDTDEVIVVRPASPR